MNTCAVCKRSEEDKAVTVVHISDHNAGLCLECAAIALVGVVQQMPTIREEIGRLRDRINMQEMGISPGESTEVEQPTVFDYAREDGLP